MKKAIAEYRQALVLDPDHYWALFQLGRCSLSLGRLAEAVETLGTCVALKPQSPWAYSVRGLASLSRSVTRRRRRTSTGPSPSTPTCAPPLLNRGVVYWMEKKYDQALADFAAVLQPPKEQRLFEAAYYRGQLYLEQGELPKALQDFDLVLAENPHFRPVYLVRARVHFAQKDAKLGLQDLDAYLAPWGPFAPNGWDRFGLRALVSRHVSRPATGEAPATGRPRCWNWGWESCNRPSPWGVAPGTSTMTWVPCMNMQARPKKPWPRTRRGWRSPPPTPSCASSAWVYEAFNRHDDALADFAAAAKAEPENAEAHSGLGYVRASASKPRKLSVKPSSPCCTGPTTT